MKARVSKPFYYFLLLISYPKATAPTASAINAISPIGIHNGAVTHHHDHLATGPISASFNVRKIKKINDPIPNPPEFVLPLILFFF